MNDHPAPAPDASDAADQALRRLLREVKPPRAETDALANRVFAQWGEHQSRQAATPTVLGAMAGSATTLGQRASHRWRWASLGSGLLACAVIAAIVWVQRPDPALEELLQADVLSQMAIDEM